MPNAQKQIVVQIGNAKNRNIFPSVYLMLGINQSEWSVHVISGEIRVFTAVSSFMHDLCSILLTQGHIPPDFAVRGHGVVFCYSKYSEMSFSLRCKAFRKRRFARK